MCLLKTWRNCWGQRSSHVYRHDLMSMTNYNSLNNSPNNSLRNCVLILFLGCRWCSQVRMFSLLIFSNDKFNIREYFYVENQTHTSSHNSRVKVGNFCWLTAFVFYFAPWNLCITADWAKNIDFPFSPGDNEKEIVFHLSDFRWEIEVNLVASLISRKSSP